MALAFQSYSDNSGAGWGDGTSSTVSSVSIGTAAATRVVVLLISPTNDTLTGLTIGGVAATSDSTGNFWKAAVPTGTTATVVGTGDQIEVWGRWSYTGDASATWGTGASGGGGNGGSGNSVSVSVSAGGSVIALGEDLSGATCTFTSGVTLDGHPESVVFGASLLAAGHTDYASAQSVTVGVSASAANAGIFASPLNPSGGGGGTSVSANPTGNAGTGSAGTPTVSGKANITPAKVTGTGAAGTPTVSGKANVTLTGVAGTGSAGAVTTAVTATTTLTGNAATGSAGTPTVTGVGTVTLTGAAGTGSAGSVTVSGLANITLDGVSATGAAGDTTVTGASNVTLDSVEASGSLGTLTAQTAGNVDIAISGVSATGDVGDVTVTAEIVTVEPALDFAPGGFYPRPKRSAKIKKEIERAEQLIEDAPKVVVKAIEQAKAKSDAEISDALVATITDALAAAHAIAADIAGDLAALERRQIEQERQRAIRAAKALLDEIEAQERDEEEALALLLAS